MIGRLLLGLLAVAVLILLAAAAGTLLIDISSSAASLPKRIAEPGLSRFLTIPFAGTDGVELHYIEGAGPAGSDSPAFVLVHGFTLNAFTWMAQLPRLAAAGRTFAPDQIPYGLSEKLTASDWQGPHPYSREAAAEQLVSFMDALDLDRVILVGNSSGGTLALEVALAEPDRVAGLVLIAPWVFVKRPVFPSFIAGSVPMRRLSLFIARRLGSDGGLLEYSYADTAKITDERRQWADLHARTRNWDLAWGELLNRSLSSPVTVSNRLEQVQQPVLVVSGEADRLVPVEDSREVARRLPRASFAIVPGCGHVPHEECPDAFGDIVEDWLEQEFPSTKPSAMRLGEASN